MFGAPQKTVWAATLGGVAAGVCWSRAVEWFRPELYGEPSVGPVVSLVAAVAGVLCLAGAAYVGAAPERTDSEDTSRWLARWAGGLAGAIGASISLVPAAGFISNVWTYDLVASSAGAAEPVLVVTQVGLGMLVSMMSVAMLTGALGGRVLGSALAGVAWRRRGPRRGGPSVDPVVALVGAVTALLLSVPTAVAFLIAMGSLVSAVVGNIGKVPPWMVAFPSMSIVAVLVALVVYTAAPVAVCVRLFRARDWTWRPWSLVAGTLHGGAYAAPVVGFAIYLGLCSALGVVQTIGAATDGTPVDTADAVGYWSQFLPLALGVTLAPIVGMVSTVAPLEALVVAWRRFGGGGTPPPKALSEVDDLEPTLASERETVGGSRVA